LLAADGNDLVLQYFTVASRLGLLSPEIRFGDALQRIKPGSPLDVELYGTPGRRALSLNGKVYNEQGFSLGMGWGVVIYSGHFPLWLREILNIAWMTIWTFPPGFWSRTRSGSAAAVLLLGSGILLLPAFGTLVPTPPVQWVAAAFGFLAGICARLMVGRY
jgi:hypothetical protein